MHMQINLKRYCLSASIAVVVTGGLILVMHYAIHTDEASVRATDPLPTVSWVPQIEEPEPPVRERIEPRPRPPVEPPLVPRMLPTVEGGDGGGVVYTTPEVQPIVDVGGGVAEGDLLPVLTVAPEYPARMLARGVEGWVLVEFAVDELGRVQTPRVMDAQPGSGFNNAALRAVLRYKYKPRVINGQPVRVDGVRQRILFTIGA